MRLVESLGDEYIRRALVEILIIGTLCGVVGVQVVLRRLSFLTMALTHATFPGVVLASLVGLNLVLGAGLFGILLVLPVAALVGGRRHHPQQRRRDFEPLSIVERHVERPASAPDQELDGPGLVPHPAASTGASSSRRASSGSMIGAPSRIG